MPSRPVLVALLAAALLTPAVTQAATVAQGQPPMAQQRLQRQTARIKQGVQAGKITPAERTRLARAELAVRRHLQAIRQSGRTPTPAERQQIVRTLHRLKVAIARTIRK